MPAVSVDSCCDVMSLRPTRHSSRRSLRHVAAVVATRRSGGRRDTSQRSSRHVAAVVSARRSGRLGTSQRSSRHVAAVVSARRSSRRGTSQRRSSRHVAAAVVATRRSARRDTSQLWSRHIAARSSCCSATFVRRRVTTVGRKYCNRSCSSPRDASRFRNDVAEFFM